MNRRIAAFCRTHYLYLRLSNWLALPVLAAFLASSSAVCAGDCLASPPNIVGFWPGDANYTDVACATNGTPVGDVSLVSGVVGQAFRFGGIGSAIDLGNPVALQLQNLTIEAWVRRDSAEVATLDSRYTDGGILHYGVGGYGLVIYNDGSLSLTKVWVSNVKSTLAITDTAWHHIAVSKSATNVTFFLDGVAESVGPYNPTFEFDTPVAIGARGGDWGNAFYGAIDELAIYSRPLSPDEIQAIYNAGSAGKCHGPVFTSHPASQVGFWGKDVTFGASVCSYSPVSYQWEKDGAAITGATTDTLVLTNLQMTSAGIYRLAATNALGWSMSRPAVLTMNPAGVSVNLYAGVTIDGVVGFTYGIQHTTTLSDTNSWLGMTNVTLTSPVQLWFDLEPANLTHRFYRVVPGPIPVP